MKLQRMRAVVQRHLARTGAVAWPRHYEDHRKARGRRLRWGEIFGALWAGVLCACANLREVEELSERMGRRVSDTTLWRTLVGLEPEPVRRVLVQEVRTAWRAKEMQSLLPWSMVSVDGKTIWVGKHQANEYCQLQESNGQARYHMRVLRAVWVGGTCKLTVGQAPIAAEHNDMSAFPAFFAQLLEDYGSTDMMQVVSLDAGFASKANADLINTAERGYLIGLKKPQQELWREAHRLLSRRAEPDAQTDWERYQGKRIRRLLFRTAEMAGWNEWTHLRQVWRVRQETEKDGVLSVEERYFVTNLPSGATPGPVPLHMVRAHWGIENNSNWTLDMQWGEDDGPWASAALEVVSMMRLMAYNVAVRLRTRRLRSAANRQRTWRNILTLMEDTLVGRGLRWLERLPGRAEEVAASA